MKKGTILLRSMRMIFSGGVVVGFGMVPQWAAAQQADQDEPAVQRVEITGSSIKRIAKEGALPVQILTRADIQKTGATSTTDLLQKLPAAQGFVPAASTINGAGGQDGGGGGATTAALHAMASKYTLVLLDGQRIAPMQLGAVQGGGYGVNIGTIPLDAIERVEVLTDGASALYGADAIAGVVNFITKKNQTDGNVSFTDNRPQHPGGRSYNVGLSKGFGNLGTDNYNVLFSYSHDFQGSLLASQRPFAASGVFPFSYNGVNYLYADRSGSTSPSNLSFTTNPVDSNTKTSYSINPYFAANNNCGTASAAVRALNAHNTACEYNFAATSEIMPSFLRDSGFAKGTLRLDDETSLWSELLVSRYSVTEQFAPAAASLVVDSKTSFPTLYSTYIAPYVKANNLLAPASVTLGYRAVALGGRADNYVTNTTHFAGGIDGVAMGWSYKGTVSLSHLTNKDELAGGYGDLNGLKSLVASGSYDPVMATGAASLDSTLLTGTTVSTTTSDIDVVQLGAQHDIFSLPGGTSILSLGADFMRDHYAIDPSALERDNSGYVTQSGSTDIAIGSQAAALPFDASRNNWGVYGEWLMPISTMLEATLSDRYNGYEKAYSKNVFATSKDPATGLIGQLPNSSVGNTFSDNTYKLSFRWTPHDNLMFRGAVGTGFKAPDLSDLANPVAYSAPTSTSYACPFPGSVGCLAGPGQYSVLKGGNALTGSAGLRPEKSKQWTLGFRVDPIKNLSIGADLWYTRITDQVLPTGVPEAAAFTNPQLYPGLFINPYTTPTGAPGIGFLELTTNGGVAHYEGVDWDVSYQTKTPVGNLSTSWTGTYMLKQDYTLTPGGPVQSDLGIFGTDLNVVYRTQMRLQATLQTGAFTNSVTANFKSGYKDQQFPAASGSSVYLASDPGLTTPVAFAGLDVGSFTTFDIQSKYQVNKAFTIAGGIKNLFDRSPPLSLQTSGGGNYAGYDGRYYDPLGRTFYLNGMYKF